MTAETTEAAPTGRWHALTERSLGDAAGTSHRQNLIAFRFIVLLHAAVQSWAWVVFPLHPPWTFPVAELYIASAVLTLGAALALTRWGWQGPVLALPVLVWQLYWTFPWTANHTFLVFLIVVLFAFLNPEQHEDERLAIYSLRWMAAALLFYAGLQKVLYGYYFQGEFLSWKVAHNKGTWGTLFGLFLPADEITRLKDLGGGIGSGPYRVDSVLMQLLSNGVWVAECSLGAMLLIPRTRTVATIGGIALVFAIQTAPREFMFALIYSYMLLLWLPGNWTWRLLPLFALALVYLLAVLAGVAPGDWLLKSSGRL